jgi:uncharacterized protein
MKAIKIVIAGGTGFIGQAMADSFGKENEIIILTRNRQQAATTTAHSNPRYIWWNGKDTGPWIQELDGAHLVINLSGRTVNCRYNEKNKREIFDSRTQATEAIGAAIRKAAVPPKLWINAGSATIYRHAEDRPQDEYNGEYKNDFSVQVCKLWEKVFHEERTPFTRKVILRIAITLGHGGVMTPYFNLLKFGLGGQQGNGRQMYSWVHIADVCRTVEWAYMHKEIEGVYNCAAPNPVSNKVFMQHLRKVTGTRVGLPAHTWMLKVGAAIIGTATELVLKSRWVVPTRLLETGFVFQYPELEGAFRQIVDETLRRSYRLF